MMFCSKGIKGGFWCLIFYPLCLELEPISVKNCFQSQRKHGKWRTSFPIIALGKYFFWKKTPIGLSWWGMESIWETSNATIEIEIRFMDFLLPNLFSFLLVEIPFLKGFLVKILTIKDTKRTYGCFPNGLWSFQVKKYCWS